MAYVVRISRKSRANTDPIYPTMFRGCGVIAAKFSAVDRLAAAPRESGRRTRPGLEICTYLPNDVCERQVIAGTH